MLNETKVLSPPLPPTDRAGPAIVVNHTAAAAALLTHTVKIQSEEAEDISVQNGQFREVRSSAKL
jgi:hypothetical protein